MEVERNRQLSPHIQAWELYTHGAHGFKERPILEEHIPKYKDTLEFAERLRFLMNWIRRDRLNKKAFSENKRFYFEEQGIQVTSGYRHLAYNLKIKSSRASMHTDPTSKTPFAPCALDLTPASIKGEGAWSVFSYDEFWEMAKLVDDLSPQRAYRLGYYGKSLFVHVDCGYGHGKIRWIGN